MASSNQGGKDRNQDQPAESGGKGAGSKDAGKGAGRQSAGSGSKQASDTSNRGFASMDPARQREIASEGGRAAHEKGTAHEFTSEEARRAGSMSHKNDRNSQSGAGGSRAGAGAGSGAGAADLDQDTDGAREAAREQASRTSSGDKR